MKYYTVQEAADELKVCTKTLRDYIKQGKIFASKQGKQGTHRSPWLIREDALTMFISNL